MSKKENIDYAEGKGISQLKTIPDQQKLERNKNLEYYKDIVYQCGKCGTCRTAYQEDCWPRVCPSGEFGKFEAYYLGGKNLLSWAVTSGQLKWTKPIPEVISLGESRSGRVASTTTVTITVSLLELLYMS